MQYSRCLSILILILFIRIGIGNDCAFAQGYQYPDDHYAEKALAHFKSYSYDTSAMFYDSAIAEVKQAGNKNLTAYYLLKKGNALRNGSLSDSSFRILQNAKQMASHIRNDSIQALTEIELGYIYLNKGVLDSAAFSFQHSLSLYELAGDSVGIGLALHHLSAYYQIYTNLELSLKYALESNRIFNKFGHKEFICRSLLNLGNIYDEIGEYDTAFACFNACYALSLELNNLVFAIKAAGNKGYMYLYWKQNNKAKEAFLDAIAFCHQINNYKRLSLYYRNLSIAQKRLGELNDAFESAQKSLFFARKVDHKEYEFYALINLGVYYKNIKKQYDSAELYYLQAAQIGQEHDFKTGKRKIYSNLSKLYKTTGDFENSLKYLEKYIQINDSIINTEKADAREKYKAEYELLHYQDLNRLKELEKKKIRFERNLSFGLGITAIVLLVLILFFFRMRARKNRIIAAQKIQKLEDEKKLMAAQSVMVGEEKERERIARELHDGIGVLLSTASIHFSSVEEKADKKTSEMLNKANKLLKDASKEVRQISHNMMPGVLSKFGLREAIEDLCEDIEEASGISLELQLKCKDERLSQNMEIMIYRVVQEMLNNTIKHAKASLIKLSMIREEMHLQIEYSDDGLGFDENKLPHGKNIGLSGIRSRIEYLGGSTALSSEPGKGTSYFISIPLKA